eukprot:scaffold17798_cov55-Phaeocystis_antarctica.AAC.2
MGGAWEVHGRCMGGAWEVHGSCGHATTHATTTTTTRRWRTCQRASSASACTCYKALLTMAHMTEIISMPEGGGDN